MAKYQCSGCGYVYDEVEGCAREGYEPGTPWTEIPDDFPCPDCFVREKPDFQPYKTEATS
ncbi:rubredoxin [Litorivivens sp.]|uniref:rubredoxin n=1 Tax=Litorivivens sp. TaxID=2020868 RepID=UPI0035631C4A